MVDGTVGGYAVEDGFKSDDDSPHLYAHAAEGFVGLKEGGIFGIVEDREPRIKDVIAQTERLDLLCADTAFAGQPVYRLCEAPAFPVQLVDRPQGVLPDAILQCVLPGREMGEGAPKRKHQPHGDRDQIARRLAGPPNGLPALDQVGFQSTTSISLICHTEREKYFSL
ncbi:hypothetical protein [Mesorhizobium huakuii]|uniref:hypothetical protein n=1 Tax=Mesorhizobium huakuii TaxID=28104 RepID=UPI0024E10DC7|nr:hypothetical protein [Mesorhizobium huakuii]